MCCINVTAIRLGEDGCEECLAPWSEPQAADCCAPCPSCGRGLFCAQDEEQGSDSNCIVPATDAEIDDMYTELGGEG